MMLSEIVKSQDSQTLVKNILLFFIIVILMSVLIKYLWNNALVPHITVLKPVTSLLDALLLSFALNLIR